MMEAPEELTPEQVAAYSRPGKELDPETLALVLAEIERIDEEERMRGWN